MLQLQMPVDVARWAYDALFARMEQLGSFDQTPQRVIEIAGIDQALATLDTAADRAGVNLRIPDDDLANLERAIASLQAHIESLPPDAAVLTSLNHSLAGLIDAYRDQSGDPHMTFERDREFDRTHPGYWDWDATSEKEKD